MGKWYRSWNADPGALALADRHYSRQHIGSNQFMPPGRQLVLLTGDESAVWGTAWPFARYVNRAWPDAWLCCIFRNEGALLSSDLIREAVAITRHVYGEPPPSGFITFIDTTKVRRKRDWGRCYKRAGFVHCGYTKAGLYAVQLRPEDMPEPQAPAGDRRPPRLLRQKASEQAAD